AYFLLCSVNRRDMLLDCAVVKVKHRYAPHRRVSALTTGVVARLWPRICDGDSGFLISIAAFACVLLAFSRIRLTRRLGAGLLGNCGIAQEERDEVSDAAGSLPGQR